ncbi:hypothetical protein ADUPG1_000002 [Aduncisulcus paluster]|uniref:Uncharacterized protein n=1 Tax=Aduncisulcus paluster TaxID=2918883 RepID=A0ABQ5K443_9EUKA|nr:hypothetical protein ADUPG1_000002 [Aduncisulcus paluster]
MPVQVRVERPLSSRQLLEYIADLLEQILKSQEREGITKVADAVHIATTWRKDDGKKHIDEIIESSSGGDRSLLEADGCPIALEASARLLDFIKYSIKNAVKTKGMGTQPSRRIRDDDSFVLIPRQVVNTQDAETSSEHQGPTNKIIL